ncbi:MAG: scaffold protein [Sphingomonadales bacterium]|nr:scaffold protein [Sphingomonadales bacterium]
MPNEPTTTTAPAATTTTVTAPVVDTHAAYTPPASQADLDRIIGDRLAREREKFADYADLKTKATEYDKAIEAARTDQEKAVEAARNEGKSEALTTANARLVSAEARALAAEAKFASPALAVKALDLADVKVNDDGSVDADVIKTKLKELADSGAFVIGDGEKPKPRPDKAQGGAAGKGDSSVARGREMFEARRTPIKTS